tara:strand:+ start:226 stop:774 length:549 start_codon:yes stop_codon:yes gene_type:complete
MFVQLGLSGKEGTCMLVKEIIDGVEVEYAKKIFKKTKSPKMVQKEAELQEKAYNADVAPKVISVDLSKPPSITMEKMDKTIIDVINEQNGILTEEQQIQILSLYQKLDNIGLLHNDSNPLNIMIVEDEWKLIDYGMSKKITKKHGTSPNVKMSLKFMLYSINGIITRKILKTPPTTLINAIG